MNICKHIMFILFAVLVTSCCDDDPDKPANDLARFPYDPVAYVQDVPNGFPALEIPADNPMTEAGVELGRFLFYDKLLSIDSTMSCASCHMQEFTFTDQLATTPGVDGINGRRSSMSLLNVAFFQNGLFWDGRAPSLEAQALGPVEDPLELHDTWPNVVNKLRRHEDYPRMFRAAFGIDSKTHMTKDLAVKAIAQFERQMVSSGQSKWDRVQANQAAFTDEELLGLDLFFDENDQVPDAECGHCHSPPLFSANDYFNNGLDEAMTLQDFPDFGRGEVSMVDLDNGKFRAPSLRNIEFTAPYMHDGRFQTLEEVLDHYISGGKESPNKDALILELGLNNEHKEALIAFMKTLSEPDFHEIEALSDPFD